MDQQIITLERNGYRRRLVGGSAESVAKRMQAEGWARIDPETIPGTEVVPWLEAENAEALGLVSPSADAGESEVATDGDEAANADEASTDAEEPAEAKPARQTRARR